MANGDDRKLPAPAGDPGGSLEDVGAKLEASLKKGVAVQKQRTMRAEKLRELVDRSPDKVASALRAMIHE